MTVAIVGRAAADCCNELAVWRPERRAVIARSPGTGQYRCAGGYGRNMTAIWTNPGSGWTLLAPTGFPSERELHDRIEAAPQMLPLAGDPTLTMVGREVALGGNSADLLALEPGGRLVIIEVKLRRNAEARRAVVAQALSYAAFLHGMDPDQLERDILGRHLRDRGYGSLLEALEANVQEGVDAEALRDGLLESLKRGEFRVVLVLDEAPTELVRLVGYLEAIGDHLVVDLVTVAAYDIAGTQVLIPQRVEPERQYIEDPAPPRPPRDEGYLSDGSVDFAAAISNAPETSRDDLQRLCRWAEDLEQQGLARLATYHGKGRMTLLPRLPDENVGLVTIWNDNGASLQLWRSVFDRRAPQSLPRVEEILGMTLGAGKVTRSLEPEVLSAVTAAYREAANRP